MIKKKIFIIAAACCMTLSMFSGCGKKDIDYNMDEPQGGGLAKKLGIPETVEEALNTGESGLTSLSIDASEVHLPDTDHMSVVYCTADEMTPERRQEIAEKIFGKEGDIYVYDYENRIRSELQAELDRYEEQRETESAQGYDTSWIDEAEAELLEELKTAPDEYPVAENYEKKSYIGTYNGREYMLSMYDDGGVYLHINLDDFQYRPVDAEGVVNGYYTYSDGCTAEEREAAEGANTCAITKDEAEGLALSLLDELGISDIMLDEVYPLEWTYYDERVEIVQTDYDGYVFKFARSVDGGKICDINIGFVENLYSEDSNLTIPAENYYVYVDDNGVLEFYFQDMYTFTGEVESDVDLLSFSELMEKANTSVAQYYTVYPTNYSSIEYNGVYLTYFITADEDKEAQYQYIPVWVFTAYEEGDTNWNEQNPDQMVVLDARDGSYIDLLQLSKDLGTDESYYETTE